MDQDRRSKVGAEDRQKWRDAFQTAWVEIADKKVSKIELMVQNFK